MSKITYEDKVTLHENTEIADTNKCRADDLNEIKTVVNGLDDSVTTNTTNIATNKTNIGTLSSLTTSSKTNLVNAINEVNSYTLRPTILYSNSSGTRGDITISGSTSTYKYLEIFYRDNDNNYSSRRFKYRSSLSRIELFTESVTADASAVRLKGALYIREESKFTFISYCDWNLTVNTGDKGTSSSSSVIFITDVIGWK